MRFVLKAVVFLVLAGGIALVGYAIFSDLPAPTQEVTLPVQPR